MSIKAVWRVFSLRPPQATPEVADAVKATYAEVAKARTVIARIADDDAERARKQLGRH